MFLLYYNIQTTQQRRTTMKKQIKIDVTGLTREEKIEKINEVVYKLTGHKIKFAYNYRFPEETFVLTF